MSLVEAADLTNCDQEPIHIPGSIQPHGCLLACDANVAVVQRHSQNAGAMLGIEGPINGRPVEELFGAECTHKLRNALATSNDASRPALLFDVRVASGKRFNIAVHRYKSNSIIEFEPTAALGKPLQLTRELIGRVRDIDAIDRLLAQSARLIRGLLGYDRVMVYRFEEDGAGKVLSEAKRGDLESFLGQYFPASDIPTQARALYLRNTIRIISDSDGERIPIVPVLDEAGESLDLSFAHLRSVSPVHCEYLRNMGVAASMSISVIVDGALWGLIACHHYSPRTLPMAERVAAEMFGEFFSLHLSALKQKRRLGTANAARQSLDRFLRLASHHTDIAILFRENLPDFARLVPCDGAGLWIDGEWTGLGAAPPPEAAPGLAKFISAVAENRVWNTHALIREYPAAEPFSAEVSGVLAIPLSHVPRDYLLFFRKELVQTLNWAGNPDKSYGVGPLGDRLTPRKSFAIWKETVRHQAQPWTEEDQEIAEAARAATFEVVLRHSELMAEERARADVRQRMLNEELNHRVKNILAVIKSLVGHPVQEGRSVKDYVASLRGRIQALALAHDQVIRSDGGGPLVDLLNAELSPYRSSNDRIVLNGPPLWLDSRAFSVMALVLHEMATNAAKYGALSQAGGKLDITWRLAEEGSCEIQWRESGLRLASPPSRSGFGSALINRSIPYDLGGQSSVDFLPDGVRAQFILPAKYLSVEQEAGDGRDPRSAATATSHSPLVGGLVVLVLEDQMLIALDVETTLIDHGAAKVITASSVCEALERLREVRPDVAVLDVNLGQDTSIPFAKELRRRNIPFVFATGYGDKMVIPPDLSDVPMVRKPFGGEALLAALSTVMKEA